MTTLRLVLFVGLVAASGCYTAQVQTIKRNPAKEQWALLHHELESPPIYTYPPTWEPAYLAMLELGVEPLDARVRLRRAARFGPSIVEVTASIDEAPDGQTLLRELDLAYAEKRDERRATKPHPSGYRHEPRSTEADVEWAETAGRIEKFPILASPLQWQPEFKDMVRLGITPKRAAVNVWRSARYGPSRDVVGKLLDDHADDPDGFQHALDLIHAATKDRPENALAVYSFLKGEKAQAGPQIGQVSGAGDDGPVSGRADAVDPRLRDVAKLTAVATQAAPPADLGQLAADLKQLAGSNWDALEAFAIRAEDAQALAGLHPETAEILKGFKQGVNVVALQKAAELRDIRHLNLAVMQMADEAGAAAMLDALEQHNRAEDMAGKKRTADGTEYEILAADYETSRLNVPGFALTKRVSTPGGELTIRAVVVASGVHVVQIIAIEPAGELETLRSLADQVLAMLPI